MLLAGQAHHRHPGRVRGSLAAITESGDEATAADPGVGVVEEAADGRAIGIDRIRQAFGLWNRRADRRIAEKPRLNVPVRISSTGRILFHGETVMLSARNQLPAIVKSVKLGNVMAEVVMEVAGVEIVSAITRGSAGGPPSPAGRPRQGRHQGHRGVIDKD